MYAWKPTLAGHVLTKDGEPTGITAAPDTQPQLLVAILNLSKETGDYWIWRPLGRTDCELRHKDESIALFHTVKEAEKVQKMLNKDKPS